MKGTAAQQQLATMQAVMRVLGYYDGAVDGVWGPKCVTAIRSWECDDSFDPALPTRGYPITYPSRLPKGLTWQPGAGTKIMFSGLPAEQAAKVKELLEAYTPITSSDIDAALDPAPAAKVEAAKVEPVVPVVHGANVVQQGRPNQGKHNHK